MGRVVYERSEQSDYAMVPSIGGELQMTRSRMSQPRRCTGIPLLCCMGMMLIGATGDRSMGEEPPVSSSESARTKTRVDLSRFKSIVVADRPRGDLTCLDVAAAELRKYLHAMTGSAPELLDNRRVQRGPLLVIGDCDTARRLAPDVVPERLGFEEFVVAGTAQGDLVFIGRDDTASMFAVFSFLEACGVRWYTPEVEHVPRVRHAVVALPLRDRPVFPWRLLGQHVSVNDGPQMYPGISRAALWALHHKLITQAPRIQTHPGWPVDGVHTSGEVIAQSKYARDHPEYFSLVDGVRRVKGKYQPCFTNANVIGLLADSALTRMRSGPVFVADLSQTDSSGVYCRCASCAAIAKSSGSEAGPVFQAMNTIAAITSKEFPDRYVCALAYQWSRQPPAAMDIHPNVFVWYAPIGRNLLQPLNASKRATDLQGWRAKTGNILLWDYMTNFRDYLLPTPNLDVILEDLRCYEALGIRGLYLQGAKYEGSMCDFMDLRAYVLARALWNPESVADLRTEAHHFFDVVYGPAAADVREYFDLLYGLDRSGSSMRDVGGVSGLYTREFLAQGRALLDRAWSNAFGTAAHGRVAILRLSILLAILQNPELADVDEETLRDFVTTYLLCGSPVLQEDGTSTLANYAFWDSAKSRALNRSFENVLADARIEDIDGTPPAGLPDSFAQMLRGGEWRESLVPTLPGPRHSFTVALPAPRLINTVTIAVWKDVKEIAIEVEDESGFGTVYDSSRVDPPTSMCAVTFPEKNARRIRFTINATGFRDSCRMRRITAGLNPSVDGTKPTVTDYGHLLGGTVVKEFGIDSLAQRNNGTLQPATHLGRPYLRAMKDAAAVEDAPAAIAVDFEIKTAGFYVIEGLPLGADGASDSFNLRLQDLSTGASRGMRWKFDPTDYGSFVWSAIYRVHLPAGRYRLEMLPREPNAGIAGLRVVHFMIPAPSSGDAASGR